MSDKIIIPTSDAVVAPLLEKLYEKRPTAFKHLDTREGRYWHPVEGFRAQAALVLQRLANLAKDRRLNTAEGKALLDYVASEFEAVPDTTALFARGSITLTRTGSSLPVGYVPKGTRISRSPSTVLGIDYEAAEFVTEIDAVFPKNSVGPIVIPMVASREGSHANTPVLTQRSTPPLEGLGVPAVVPNLIVVTYESSGGSNGVDDAFVRRFARSYALGQYGPTSAASVLGALSTSGVRRVLVHDDVAAGAQVVQVADGSWASSERLHRLVKQNMYDADLIGFGCKVVFRPISNRVIHAEATVSLRDVNYLGDTTEIDQAIQGALRTYFDERVDWNVWNTQSAKNAVVNSHEKILNCLSITIKDADTNAVLTEILSPDYQGNPTQPHFYLANNAVTTTYTGPT